MHIISVIMAAILLIFEWLNYGKVNELEKMGYKVLVRDYEMSNAKRHTDIDVAPSIKLIDAIKFV